MHHLGHRCPKINCEVLTLVIINTDVHTIHSLNSFEKAISLLEKFESKIFLCFANYSIRGENNVESLY